MKKLLFSIPFLLFLASPVKAELNVKAGVIPDALVEGYQNPIDQDIAIATYELLSDAPKGLNRLEQTLNIADPSRRIQIESLLFLNYIHHASPTEAEQSIEWLNRAAQLKPDDPRPYRQLREVYCITQKLKQCKTAHREAVKRSDDETAELTRLASILQSMGRLRDASTVVNAAIEAESEKTIPNQKRIKRLRRWLRKISIGQ